MEDYKKLVKELLELSHNFRFVGIIDSTHSTLYSKMKNDKPSLITESEEEEFAMDLQTIKEIQNKFNDRLGKIIFSHIVRGEIQQLIFQMENIIIYITCDLDVKHNAIIDVSKLITDIVKNKKLNKLEILPGIDR